MATPVTIVDSDKTGPENLVFAFLDTVGDGTGTHNAIGDYSSTAQDFKITAQTDEVLTIERMIVMIEDGGTFNITEYGNVATLTNGIEVKVTDSDDSTLLDLTDGEPITHNADWGRHCYDIDIKAEGSGNNVVLVRWTFANAGKPVTLKPGQSLVVSLNDNFTGIVEHYFQAHGYKGTD